MRRFLLLVCLFIFFHPTREVLATQQSALTLQDAIRIGLENNLKIAQSSGDYKKATHRHSKKVFFPNINASIGSGFAYNSSKLRYAVSSTEVAIHLPINLFDKYFSYQKNSLKLDIKRCELTLNEISKAAEIATAYFKVALEQKILEIRRTAMETSKQHNHQIELAYTAGKEPRSRYTNSLIQYNNDLVAFYEKENDLAKAKMDLCDLIGKRGDENFFVDAEIALSRRTESKFSNISVDSSNSLALAKYELSLANLNVSSLAYRLLPSISFKVGYRLDKDSLAWDKRISYGATTTFNIFEMINLNDEISCGNIDLDYLYRSALVNEVKLRTQLDTYLLLYKKQQEHLALIQKNLDLSMQNFRTMQEQYELGKISALEYKEAKRNSEICEVHLLKTLYQMKVYELKIISITCGSIEDFLNEVMS